MRIRMSPPARAALLDGALIFVLAAALIWPLFRLEYLNNWSSIESTFIADARFLRDHWPHPQWQPLWYGGTRFDYVYPPAMRYGTAALARWLWLEPARAYHLFTAILYCLGIAGVYALARVGTRSRAAGWVAAVSTALVSPSFLLLKRFRLDSIRLEPQRLHVLVRYGEGPHMSALALLGFMLAASWVALRTGRRTAFAAAALCAALVALTNFYALTALALLFPLMVWAVWVADGGRSAWARAAGISVLGYALTAFWLTPSYLRVTLNNLKLVAGDGNMWSVWVSLAAIAVFAFLSWRFARGKKNHAWTVFVCGALLVFTLNSVGYEAFGLLVAGNPDRFVPEFDLVLVLAALEALRWMWTSHHRMARIVAAVVICAALFSAQRYVRHAWQLFPNDPNWRNRVEYRLMDWVAHNLPGSRAVATGSTRFWYDAWHDLPQVGGGSDQGLINQLVTNAMWELVLGPQPVPGNLWLQAFGADAVIVNGKNSQDEYRDFKYPDKFAGMLPVLYNNGAGDMIYRVPRRFPGLARVVDRTRALALAPIRHNVDVERLQPYVDVAEGGGPAAMAWHGTDEIRIQGDVGAGQFFLVQVTYDPAWRAYAGANPLTIHKDAIGQMLVDAPPGRQEIQLVFEMPLENRIGWVVTCAALLGLVALVALDFMAKLATSKL